MPEPPSREPFFVLAARYLSRLGGIEPERDGLARRASDAADEHDGYFSQMIGFAPEGGGDDAVDEDASAPLPASQPPAPAAAGPASKA